MSLPDAAAAAAAAAAALAAVALLPTTSATATGEPDGDGEPLGLKYHMACISRGAGAGPRVPSCHHRHSPPTTSSVQASTKRFKQVSTPQSQTPVNSHGATHRARSSHGQSVLSTKEIVLSSRWQRILSRIDIHVTAHTPSHEQQRSHPRKPGTSTLPDVTVS